MVVELANAGVVCLIPLCTETGIVYCYTFDMSLYFLFPFKRVLHTPFLTSHIQIKIYTTN